MTDEIEPQLVKDYVERTVRDRSAKDASARCVPRRNLFEKTFSVLPARIMRLFLSGSRSLDIMIMADMTLPSRMNTIAKGPPAERDYTIIIFREHLAGRQNHFVGSLLRELAHVVIETPPEDEWPTSRAERSHYREKLELLADAEVWRWGLRHYDMAHIAATYPRHWADRITEDIERLLKSESH